MFTTAYKRYALATMTGVYTLNLVDRGLMTLLLEPIKTDLGLTDTQLGMLTGIAFGTFYAILGLPIARWADRGNRVTIASLAIGLWGLTVMSCVFVTQYAQLVVARIAAAVGESGCKPPTYSLLGDYFKDPRERTRAMSIYIAGSPLAALLSFVVGGWLNELYGWRMTFFLMGVPGLFLALLVRFTVAEPRTFESIARQDERRSPSTRDVLRVLYGQRSLRNLSIALILLYTTGQGLSPWYAAFMIRSHGMETAELGVWFGVIFSVAGVAGVLCGGYLASSLFADNERRQMAMSAVSFVLVVPFFVTFVTVAGKYQALLTLVPLAVMFNVFLGPTYALMQRLVVDDMRATMMAVIMLLANLIGFGLGPQIVGILSDLLQPSFGIDALRYAMLAMSFIWLWAAYHFWQVSRTVREDLSALAGHRRADDGSLDPYAATTKPVLSQ